jgi:hypothetical protein
MTHPGFDSYGKADGGFRLVPDGRGGIKYIKTGNAVLREIPAAERLLEIQCWAAGSRRGGPRLVAVLTKDWRLSITGNPAGAAEPGVLFTQCACGPGGHRIDLARVQELAEMKMHRSRKARTIDVRSVERGPDTKSV